MTNKITKAEMEAMLVAAGLMPAKEAPAKKDKPAKLAFTDKQAASAKLMGDVSATGNGVVFFWSHAPTIPFTRKKAAKAAGRAAHATVKASLIPVHPTKKLIALRKKRAKAAAKKAS